MANSVLMFDAIGDPSDQSATSSRRGELIDGSWSSSQDEAYCQPCVSPVWDTALAAHALLEVGGEAAEATRSTPASTG